jgi:hypothetical protein
MSPVERPRSTLLPALGAGLKRLVEGGSSILKLPEKGDKMGTQNYLAAQYHYINKEKGLYLCFGTDYNERLCSLEIITNKDVINNKMTI